ncbi:tetratricopeptide repeat protein [Sphaerisporangium sp. NPDC005288]|uniref:AfsR/SARP family transcriptional regulator n=1 Tax=Sphaerisporangium sp. NPDC005288 TaxID=3155114 RepID=UPI0033A127B7
MEFRILGPVELCVRERRHDLGWAKERLVMAALMLTPGRPVPIRSLIAKLWDGDPPPKAAAHLQSSVSRLKKRLREIGAAADGTTGGARLHRVSGSYILETDAENIDYHRFLRLRTQARASAETGDIEEALRLYRDAQSLWRGEPLAGLQGSWADNTRRHLEEEMIGGTVERITLELGRGDHSRLIPELSDLVTRFPLDETLVGLLMRALYASGRQADALSAYRQARERLHDQLAAEPAAGLRDLHQRILRHDPALAVRSRAGRAQEHAPPNDLPRDLRTFTGRAAELASLTSERVLGGTAVPVLAVDGMPGVGKTTFAVHLAHRLAARYPDGRVYLDLHGHSARHQPLDPAAALDRLLRHLGVPGDIPEDLDARAAKWRKELAGRRILVVLDDATGHQQVRPLLPGEPGCLVIVTSRRRLSGLEGVEPLSLDVLPPEDAAELFRRAAGSHRPAEPESVAAVTRLCGHLPLAIQMVGSRLRHHPAWTVADLADRLSREGRRLAEIRAENREITAAFRLSYEGLSEFQRRGFTRLGFHPGTEITAHCAAVLLECPLADAERFLEDLLEYHLLAEPRPGRHRLHELIRDYAVSLAAQEPPDVRAGAVRRVLDHHLFLADRADRLLYQHRTRIPVDLEAPPRTFPDIATADQARRWLTTELDDLLRLTRYAADHGHPRHAAMYAHVLSGYLYSWGHWDEAVAIHRNAIDAWRRLGDERGVARAMTDLSEALGRTGRLDESLRLASRALRIQTGREDRQGSAELLDQIGLAHWHRADFDVALGHFERALALKRDGGDRYSQAVSLNHIAGVAEAKGDYRTAADRLREVLTLHEEDGDLRGRQVVLNNIGEVKSRLGDHQAALRHYEQAASLAIETAPKDRAILAHNMAGALRHLGRHFEALDRYQEALRVYRDLSDRRSVAQTLNSIGSCHTSIGQVEQALAHHRTALQISTELLERQQQARALRGLGDASQRAGRHHDALDFYGRALDTAQSIGDAREVAEILHQTGSTHEHLGDLTRAERLWRRAAESYERLGLDEARALRKRIDQGRQAP